MLSFSAACWTSSDMASFTVAVSGMATKLVDILLPISSSSKELTSRIFSRTWSGTSSSSGFLVSFGRRCSSSTAVDTSNSDSTSVFCRRLSRSK